MKKVWMGVLGCALLIEGIYGYENGYVVANQNQEMVLAKEEMTTGSAVTATNAGIVTDVAIITATEVPVVEEQRVSTPIEDVNPGLENTEVVASDSQVKNAIKASLKKKSIKLGVGEQVKMPVKNRSGLKVTYQVKNKRVASVNKKGIIRGKALGKTAVYAKISTKTLVLKAQVKKKPSSIKIKRPKLSSVSIGTKISLKVVLSKGAASYKIRWASSKKSVATVNASGVLVIKGRGRTTITAKTYNGKTAKIVFSLH